jgi:hypothetical protein
LSRRRNYGTFGQFEPLRSVGKDINLFFLTDVTEFLLELVDRSYLLAVLGLLASKLVLL